MDFQNANQRHIGLDRQEMPNYNHERDRPFDAYSREPIGQGITGQRQGNLPQQPDRFGHPHGILRNQQQKQGTDFDHQGNYGHSQHNFNRSQQEPRDFGQRQRNFGLSETRRDFPQQQGSFNQQQRNFGQQPQNFGQQQNNFSQQQRAVVDMDIEEVEKTEEWQKCDICNINFTTERVGHRHTRVS